jgi:hypothetical protein
VVQSPRRRDVLAQNFNFNQNNNLSIDQVQSDFLLRLFFLPREGHSLNIQFIVALQLTQ